jgi:hypothetical protein
MYLYCSTFYLQDTLVFTTKIRLSLVASKSQRFKAAIRNKLIRGSVFGNAIHSGLVDDS